MNDPAAKQIKNIWASESSMESQEVQFLNEEEPKTAATLKPFGAHQSENPDEVQQEHDDGFTQRSQNVLKQIQQETDQGFADNAIGDVAQERQTVTDCCDILLTTF